MAIAETRHFAPAEGSTIQANLKGKIRVDANRLTELVAAFFRHNKMPAKDAMISAQGIVLADLVGHESHGVSNNLAGFYLPDLESGVVNARPNIRITRALPSTATWEADGAMGFVGPPRARRHRRRRGGRTGRGDSWSRPARWGMRSSGPKRSGRAGRRSGIRGTTA